MQGARSVLTAVLLLALPALSCPAWSEEPPGKVTITYTGDGRERPLLPLDSFARTLGELAELLVVRSEVEAAQKAMLRASRRGSRSAMRIERDGAVIEGENHYIAGRTKRMREIRPGYTAVIVGDTLCYTEFMKPPSCQQAHYTFGLPDINWKAVSAASRAPAACAHGECTLLEITHHRTMAVPIRGRIIDMVDPATSLVEQITIDAASRPVTITSREYLDGELVASAQETFDFHSPVEPIELPADRDLAGEGD
jgi:hypothetical protein